ncbi:hypothetical protein [Corynebacterium rouxii]|uniref:Uncharacterized protein n=1 Tax=Corynebacterium rouxii TaxID=2719119 RepID=A0A6I8MD27_9CORY|nr:hypothetical protein [Corynebacterium rouxii]VZH84154.1 hypothetical protein FRC0190_00192 [Corynebacterium rouxii]
MERIELWIRRTVGNASDREIGKLAQIGQSTLSRQRRDGTVTVETAVKIARAYQVSVIPALIALDVVTEDDLKEFAMDAAIEDADDETLGREVIKRMKQGSALMSMPIGEVENQLEARRNAKLSRNSPATPPHVTTPDYDSILDGINAGTEKIAAQKATDPLEENYT